MRRTAGSFLRVFFSFVIGVAGCGDDGGSAGDGGDAATGTGTSPSGYKVSGTVVDFETGAAPTQVSVTTAGLNPTPSKISTAGADFAIEGVAPHSVFFILSASPPDYRATYNEAAVEIQDVSGVTVQVLAEAYIDELAAAFGVTPQADKGILVIRAIDESGVPKAGVPAAAFRLNDVAPARGPYFLDAAKQPVANATATTDGGWAVFFDVEPGLVTVTAAGNSGYTMSSAQTPAAGGTASLADVVVVAGAPVPPANVSFSAQVVPIFSRRGCVLCHSGGGPGKDLGGLMLDAGLDKTYREITLETSPLYNKLRIDRAVPEASLLLTMPSVENPPDRHPNATFASPADPDYQLIYTWIKEGAKQN